MPPKGKVHTCSDCKETFTSKIKLNQHTKAKHTNNNKNDEPKIEVDMDVEEIPQPTPPVAKTIEIDTQKGPLVLASLANSLKQNMLNFAGTAATELTAIKDNINETNRRMRNNAVTIIKTVQAAVEAKKSSPAEAKKVEAKKSGPAAKKGAAAEEVQVIAEVAGPSTGLVVAVKGKAASAKNAKEDNQFNFKKYMCAKCNRAFTTAGSHKRHESTCKATSKIVLEIQDTLDSEPEPEDIEVDDDHSSTDDDEVITRSNKTPPKRLKGKGTFSKRINTLLKQAPNKRRRKTTCKKCESKYYKVDGCPVCPKGKTRAKDKSKGGEDDDDEEDEEDEEEDDENACAECGEAFLDKATFDSHDCPATAGEIDAEYLRQKALSGGKEVCATCGDTFDNKVALLEHLGTHTGANVNKAIACGICHKAFSRKYHLDRHLLLTSCSGQAPPAHVCQVCGKTYTRKDNLREHLRAHAGEVLRRKKYKCQFCSKQFHGTSLLKIHERTHTGERPYNCDFCSKMFSSTGALTKHRRIHTGEKPYDCVDCGISFSLKGTLNRHMRIHTGVRPHKCEYCGKEFIQAGGLKAHMFYHTGENGFKCADCGKLFNRKARLNMHIRYVHDKVKPFKCEDCDKGFTRKEDLFRHSVLHSGNKPHQCPTCNKRFAIKPSLKLHMLTHTKEEPRSCHECGRAFIRKDCLLRHMRKRHRDLLNKILLDEKETVTTTHNPVSVTAQRILTEQNICDSIRELLSLLVDESTLRGFGWPDKPVDQLLESVIKRCGHTPVNAEDYSYMDRLRENSKLLFTVVIDDNAVKTLLNNQTVDEVILHVLRLAKS